MSWVAIGVGVGGAVIGGVSSAAGASAQASATKKAADADRRFTQDNFDRQRLEALKNLYGPQKALQMFKASVSPERYDQVVGRAATNANFTSEQQQRVASLNQEIQQLTTVMAVSPSRRAQLQGRMQELTTQRDRLVGEAGGSTGVAGMIDKNAFDASGPGVFEEYGALQRMHEGGARLRLADYDRGTGQLMGEANELQSAAAQYGKGQETRIRTDAGRALTGANRLAESRLLSRGVAGGSALPDALRGNANAINEGMTNQLNDLGDRQIGLRLATGQQRLQMLAPRLASRSALQYDDASTGLNLATQPLSQRLQFATGGIMNPWLNRDSSQYFPGVSAGGAFAQSMGNSMSAAGGQFLNYGLMNLGQRQGGAGAAAGGAAAGYGGMNPNMFDAWMQQQYGAPARRTA